MSYSKNYQAYPQEFATLIERGALQLISLPLGTEENAKRLMGRLYAYKGALKRAAHSPDCPEAIRTLATLVDKSQFRVEGANLVIRPLDLDPDAALIRAALEQVDTPSIETGHNGQILVPVNPSHLPAWLAEYAIKRSKDAGS